MLFKDWKLLDQSSAGLSFEKEYSYYIHSRAWALKGWLGGTHAWIVFWSIDHNRWLVVELTDHETIGVQNANVLYSQEAVGFQERCPMISDRTPDAKWFGSTPTVVGKSCATFSFDELIAACKAYPFKEFKLISCNCITFVSYLIVKLNLNISRPIRSYGFKDHKFWKNLHVTK